jgi:hypothetical protein
VCSRELALNLLTRGYAVEIFSPENVPDNTADLELRVDIGPGDQLIASVQARDGEREASLEFVRHLKEPTVNSLHGLSELGEAVHFSGEPVTFNATAGIEDMGMVADALQPPVKDPSPANLVLLNRDLDPGIDTEGDVRFYRRHQRNLRRWPSQRLAGARRPRNSAFVLRDGLGALL